MKTPEKKSSEQLLSKIAELTKFTPEEIREIVRIYDSIDEAAERTRRSFESELVGGNPFKFKKQPSPLLRHGRITAFLLLILAVQLYFLLR